MVRRVQAARKVRRAARVLKETADPQGTLVRLVTLALQVRLVTLGQQERQEQLVTQDLLVL